MSEAVIIDTHVILEAIAESGQYRFVLDRLKKVCDFVVVNEGIEKEYRSKSYRHGLDPTIVIALLYDSLYRLNKLQRSPNSPKGKIPLEGIDSQDHPFINAAWWKRPATLITNDHKLHDRRKQLGTKRIRVRYPDEYN